MTKWIRLFGDQYLGFWFPGLLLFALQELPYMVMPLFRLEGDPLMHMRESSAVLDALEKALGVGCVLAMTFLVADGVPFLSPATAAQKAGLLLAAGALLLNFFGWGLYFRGNWSLWVILLFLTAMPPLYYAGIGLWRSDRALFIGGLLFGAVHLAHVYANLTA